MTTDLSRRSFLKITVGATAAVGIPAIALVEVPELVATPFPIDLGDDVAKVIRHKAEELVNHVLFVFNDDFIRRSVTREFFDVLNPIQQRKKIYQFMVKCDAVNNPPSIVDEHKLVVAIWVQPTRSLKSNCYDIVYDSRGFDMKEDIPKEFHEEKDVHS